MAETPIGALASLPVMAYQDVLNKRAASDAYDKQVALLKMQYEQSREAVREQNAYNLPVRQRERIEQAGLNPDLLYGDGTLSNLQQSVANGGSAPSAPVAQPVDVAGTLSSVADIALKAAQVKKLGSETSGQQLENQYLQASMSDRVRSVALQNGWTDEQTAKVTQEISMIVAQQNSLREQMEKTKQETKLTEQQVNWYERHMRAEIADLKASAEYKNASKGLSESQKQVLDNCMDAYTRIASASADQTEKVVSLLSRYGDAQAIVGMLSQIASSASNLFDGLFSVKKLFRY